MRQCICFLTFLSVPEAWWAAWLPTPVFTHPSSRFLGLLLCFSKQPSRARVPLCCGAGTFLAPVLALPGSLRHPRSDQECLSAAPSGCSVPSFSSQTWMPPVAAWAVGIRRLVMTPFYWERNWGSKNSFPPALLHLGAASPDTAGLACEAPPLARVFTLTVRCSKTFSPHTHTHTHTHSHLRTHTVSTSTHTYNHQLTHTHSHTQPHQLSLTHTQSLINSHTHTHTHKLINLHTQSQLTYKYININSHTDLRVPLPVFPPDLGVPLPVSPIRPGGPSACVPSLTRGHSMVNVLRAGWAPVFSWLLPLLI